ncbi:MAG: DNA polymerase III subunit chi [Pseudomonadota bacterium]
MVEIGFYHLTDTALEAVLPVMLTRAVERGWRSELRGRDPAFMETLNRTLWKAGGDGFLPHGLVTEPHAERQPVLLTTGPAGDGRDALFLIDRAPYEPAEMVGFTRAAVLFDGHDDAAVGEAREAWRATVSAGLTAIYWAQDDGRWVKKAAAGGA